MKAFTHGTVAESIGRTLGHAWMAYKREEGRVLQWMVGKGLSVGSANVALWAVKLVVLGVLLYFAFWLALILALTVAAAFFAKSVDSSQPKERPFTDGSDHKKNLFYDPINYNDDPDPRFDDK